MEVEESEPKVKEEVPETPAPSDEKEIKEEASPQPGETPRCRGGAQDQVAGRSTRRDADEEAGNKTEALRGARGDHGEGERRIGIPAAAADPGAAAVPPGAAEGCRVPSTASGPPKFNFLSDKYCESILIKHYKVWMDCVMMDMHAKNLRMTINGRITEEEDGLCQSRLKVQTAE
ncbi:hypothetical protein ACJJTC_004753 [Scirpophaga incertulas]